MNKTEDNLLRELNKYKNGYNILIEYFQSISDEEKPIVDSKLKQLGL